MPEAERGVAQANLDRERFDTQAEDSKWSQWYYHYHLKVLASRKRWDFQNYVQHGLVFNLETAAVYTLISVPFVPVIRHWWCITPAAANFLQQQARFDKFIEVFNNERPHEALGMKCPADVYQASPRPYQGLPDIDYPFHDRTIVVTHCGRICLGKKKINFSTVFAGQAVGIKEVHDDIWLVSFMDYDLGYFDLETRVLEPLENPFGPKVLPM